MIKVANLSSGYDKKNDIIKDISFTLDKGMIGVILGENGSGKSTLFKAILGLIKVKSGNILIDDKDIINVSNKERAKYIAYVSQNIIMPELSVYDVIMMGRIPYYNFSPTKYDKEKVLEVIKEFNLEKVKDKLAIELSGGQKQLVAIARAIAQEAKVIIFDEPTSNLDIKNEMLLHKEISKIAKEKNLTILISLHDINLAYDLGDKFIFLKDGVVIKEESKEEFNSDTIYKTFDKKCLIIKNDGKTYIKFIEEE